MSVVHDARQRPFGTLPTIDGYDVISEDSGRPVAHRETLREANGLAFRLNNIAQTGDRRALAKALSGGRASYH